MSWQPTRDLVGYGANPPDPKWPNGARIAVNFVVNYEEGSEPSMQDGEGYSETGLTESSTSSQGLQGRDLAATTKLLIAIRFRKHTCACSASRSRRKPPG